MPYTLLQALGYIAQHETLQWERIFSPPNSPRYPIILKINRKTNTASSYIDRSCKLRLTRRDGVRKKSMLVFKRSRTKGGRSAKCQYQPCGETCLKGTGCKICGTFVKMWVDDLEKAVPALEAQKKEKEKEREVGESDSGYSSMCES